MKKFKVFLVLAFVGLSLMSCNSSSDDEYRPDPNKGDFMKVNRMEVIKDITKEHLLEKLYTIEYNSILKPKVIKEYSGINTTVALDKAPISYAFDYLKNEEMNSILIKKNEEIELDKLVADYRSEKLVAINSNTTDYSITYDVVNANYLKATKSAKSFTYEFDNNGNLISVSDASGKLFTYKYGVGHNPFEYSEYNLIFDYVPGGDLIRFVRSSKNELISAINEKTGEEFGFEYKLHEFGFPIKMLVKGKNNTVLLKFDYSILRRPDL